MTDNSALVEKVMEKINEYYMGEDNSAEKKFDEFAAKHADKFDDDFATYMDGHEGKLEYTEAYQDFQKMFEAEMEEIIKSADVSVEQFYAALKEASQKDESAQFYVHMLLSVAEYDSVLMMMKDYKIKQKKL